MENKQVIVQLKLRVADQALIFPGTAGWVLDQIRSGCLSVSVSKDGKPGVWFRYGPNQDRSQLLALRDVNSQGITMIDHFPFEDDYVNGNEDEALGVRLTKQGLVVLTQLARKAKTILRLYLRRGDRLAQTPGLLKLSLTTVS